MQIDLEKRPPRLDQLETSLARTEQTYIRLMLFALAGLVLFVALSWGGVRFYKHWQEGHLVRRAAAIMGGGDLKSASLDARRALQINPQSAAAMRIIAEIAERTNDRTALDWRRKIWELNPSSVDDGLALVRTAFWFRDTAAAEKTLRSLEPIATNRAEFQAASARLAELKKDATGTERHWEKAAELAPNESVYRFQLALVRLGSTDAAKRKAAMDVLEELRGNKDQRAGATRTLIIDGIAHHAEAGRTRARAEELQNYPEALFSDRILYLEILRQGHDPRYDGYLAQLKAEVLRKPSEAAALITWMSRNGMDAEVAEFAPSLPAEVSEKWPIPLATADALAQAKRWPELEGLTKDRNWGGYDFLRRAYLSRALRDQEKQLAAEQELAAAIKEVSANPQALSLLTQTIADWGWQNEAIELLWTLSKNADMRTAALQTLYEHYTKTADTTGLYRVLTKLAESSPDDRVLQNNLALVSLLLGADTDHARKAAADLTALEPGNAAYVATCAFALLLHSDTKEALRLMNGLKEEQLGDPSVATYYGLILAAAGEKEKAAQFLKKSAGANLLPEEKALVEKATSSLH